MTNSAQPRTWVRVANGLAALAFASFVLVNYWPLVRLLDLARADLGYQGVWLEGHAKRITRVTPGGAMDRAGLRPGDVLEFNPARSDDWILASYRNMPEGFSGALPVRHVDGTRAVATLAPERVSFLPTLSDRLALLIRLCGLTICLIIGVVLIWARPSWMTWSLFLACSSTAPARVWSTGFLAFTATDSSLTPVAVAIGGLVWLVAFNLPFSLSFPRDALPGWPAWKRALGLLILLGLPISASPGLYVHPFAQDEFSVRSFATWTAFGVLVSFASVMVLLHTHRRADGAERARLNWAMLGVAGGLIVNASVVALFILPHSLSNSLSGSGLTPAHWAMGLVLGIVFPLALGYAVLRQKVVDVQFALSRTLVFGIVSTVVLVFLTVLHWLLGRQIEHSGLAFGLEGLAAVGLGLGLHRASHGINATVDRVLFRKHHAAEERLRHVTAALPYSTTEQSIAEAIVLEPARNLALASAALFYRESAEGPLQRVLSVGWDEVHASTLDPESFMARYLQAEHAALRLDEGQQSLPTGIPEGTAHPVLAIPIVSRHVLNAVVLYGSHVNGTLPDPDEVVLLDALAKAAALAHQQVQIVTLARDKAALAEKVSTLSGALEAQQKVIERFEMTLGRGVQHEQP